MPPACDVTGEFVPSPGSDAGRSGTPLWAGRGLGDLVEMTSPSEKDFIVDESWGCIEAIIELVRRKDPVFGTVLEDERCSVAADDVNPAGRTDG